MLLHTQSRGFELSKALESHVENKMRFVLSRYGQKVSSIDVTLVDINGPKGGEDMKCTARLKLEGKAEIVIQSVDVDMYNAISSCAARLKRTIGRHFSRLNSSHRKHIFKPHTDEFLTSFL